MKHRKLETLEQKLQCKEEGKELLLKGCYNMAARRYLDLIESGMDGLSKREQSIVYLNCGIAYQSLENPESLRMFQMAILIDESYEKPHFRRAQYYKQRGYYQLALVCIPEESKNPDFKRLKEELIKLNNQKEGVKHLIQKINDNTIFVEDVELYCTKTESRIFEICQKTRNQSREDCERIVDQESARIGTQITKLYRALNQHPYSIDMEQAKRKLIEKSRVKCMKALCEFLERLLIRRWKEFEKFELPIKDNEPMPKFVIIHFFLTQWSSEYCTKAVQSLQSVFNRKLTDVFEYLYFGAPKFKCIEQLRLIKWQQAYLDITVLSGVVKELRKISNLYTEMKYPLDESQPGYEFEQSIENAFKDDHLMLGFLEANRSDHVSASVMVDRCETSQKDFEEEITKLKDTIEIQAFNLTFYYAKKSIRKHSMRNLHMTLKCIDKLMRRLKECVDIHCAVTKPNSADPQVLELKEIDRVTHLLYIQYWQTKSSSAETLIEKISSPKFEYRFSKKQLVSFFENSPIENFIVTYLFANIVKHIPAFKLENKKTINSEDEYLKEIILKACESKIDSVLKMLAENKQVAAKDNKKSEDTQKEVKTSDSYFISVQNEIYLLLLATVLRLEPKYEIEIHWEIVIEEAQNSENHLSQVCLETLLLALVNHPKYLLVYLESYQKIIEVVKNFLSKPLIEKIESFRILLNVMYILIADFEHDQEALFAKTMGLTVEEVHKARKIQGESIDEKLKQNISVVRIKFLQVIAEKETEILLELVQLCNELEMEQECSFRLCKIISEIAKVNHSKLYQNQIIDFMLKCRELSLKSSNQKNKPSVSSSPISECGSFFQNLTKKCNNAPQLFQYKHTQSIVDCLVWQIVNSDHQLNVFESLLGLVNLSNANVRVKLQEIEKCLYQQNMYIVHAAVCVLNNVLVHKNQTEDRDKVEKVVKRISEVIQNYLEFYRDQVVHLENNGLPESDYSHPKRVYVSLVSLATVLSLTEQEELKSWETAQKCIKLLGNPQGIELMFKLAVFHSLNKTLPRNWHIDLKKQLDFVKETDPSRYQKILQLIS